MVDESYVMLGAHVDMSLRDKIAKGEYVDFTRLLPRDKAISDDRLELMHRGGQAFFVPASDRTAMSITSFARWEQAFRVFSNIYLQSNPDRATQLIQYDHIICRAALSFTWDNVYQYDKEFRAHLGNFPDRSWGIILQQAWLVCLKDRISSGNNHRFPADQKRRKEICERFNKGLCSAGRNCKYDHHCKGCGKFGHGVHICCNKNGGGGHNAQEAGGKQTTAIASPSANSASSAHV